MSTGHRLYWVLYCILKLFFFRFSCLLIAYIVCGILFNKYAREVEGKEVFPNYSFWADFLYLVKVCYFAVVILFTSSIVSVVL